VIVLAYPVFDFSFNRDYTQEIIFKTTVVQFENGAEQRGSKTLPRRRFTLQFEKLKDKTDTIWDFFIARKGKFEPFIFRKRNKITGNVEEDILVRFDIDTLSQQAFYDTIATFGLTMIEVIKP